MITAEFIKRIDNARVMLSECRTLEEVEKHFSDFNMTDYPSKTALLRRCMQIQKTDKKLDDIEDDEDTYEYFLNIFLTGKWRDTSQKKESAILSSNLSGEAVEKQTKKSKASFNIEKLCGDFNVSKEDCNSIKEFYEANILPRMQKKYFSQLISVIEDIINENSSKRIAAQDKWSKIHDMARFRITLSELPPDSGNIFRACCLILPNRATILYDPNIDKKNLRILIAHQLGYILSYYDIIPKKDIESYASLFAFFVINGENNFYASGHSSNLYQNEAEIIERIKMRSSI